MQPIETSRIGSSERRIARGARRITAGRVWRALAIALAAVVAACAVFVWLRGDALVQRAVERITSQITDTPVHVGRADVRLRGRALHLADLRVGNPGGFRSGDALRVGSVDVAAGKLRDEPIALDALRVDAPAVRVEIQRHARINIAVLRDQIRASARAGKAGSPPAQLGDVVADRLSRAHVRVKRLTIAPAHVVVDASEYGPNEPIELTLAPIALADVGGSAGMTPAELTRTISLALIEATLAKMADVDVRGTREGLPEALGGLRRTGRALLGRD